MVKRKKETFLFHFVRMFIAPLVMLRVKRITGIENVPKKGPFILASNHVSFLDPPLIAVAVAKRTKSKIRFISKIELKKFFGRYFGERWFGMIYVEKEKPGECLEIALDHLKQNGIVGIFPEGHRRYDGRLGKGRTGVARLALWAKCPVVPVGYIGPNDREVKTLPLIFNYKNEVRINFGEPMTFNSYYDQEVSKDYLRDITEQVLKKISFLTGKVIEKD